MGKTINEKIIEIQSEPNATTLNSVIRPKIQKLILDMVKLDSWTEFAKEFIEPTNSPGLIKAQLDRLTLSDNLATDTYVVQTVGYLFGNTMCTGTSRANLNANIEGVLDVEIDTTQP